ncbi:hypothetical protein NDU88_002178 [Pleurodeles waltl]|uniref:Uncharacterized protein n=1 Tax=Pleurodeles waltl TaxID=8319 RepID=A0AAV7T1N6_PLEWA|nr:hypothetical protein NDU88_002178 [Pleurodeles waltl]
MALDHAPGNRGGPRAVDRMAREKLPPEAVHATRARRNPAQAPSWTRLRGSDDLILKWLRVKLPPPPPRGWKAGAPARNLEREAIRLRNRAGRAKSLQ